MFNHAIAYVMSVLAAEKRDEKGVTAIEYAVMAAAIVGLIAAAMVILGGEITELFSGISVGA